MLQVLSALLAGGADRCGCNAMLFTREDLQPFLWASARSALRDLWLPDYFS